MFGRKVRNHQSSGVDSHAWHFFFQEMTGQGKKSLKTKRCTIQSTYVDVPDQQNECDEYANLANHDEWTEEDFTEALAQEGDDDAVYVMDFESAAKATKNWHQLIHHIR